MAKLIFKFKGPYKYNSKTKKYQQLKTIPTIEHVSLINENGKKTISYNNTFSYSLDKVNDRYNIIISNIFHGGWFTDRNYHKDNIINMKDTLNFYYNIENMNTGKITKSRAIIKFSPKAIAKMKKFTLANYSKIN